MKKSFTRKIIAASAAFTLTAMISGCDERLSPDTDPSADGIQIQGVVKLLGGTALPSFEKVDLTLNASGTGRIKGSKAVANAPGVYSKAIDFPDGWGACDESTQGYDDKKIVGSRVAWGVSIENSTGGWTTDWNLLTGTFRTNLENPCIYEPTWTDQSETPREVVYDRNPEIEVEASVLATPTLCATFCPARAAADCEENANPSTCNATALAECQTSCATPGARIATADTVSVLWDGDSPAVEEPVTPPSMPDGPLQPGDPIPQNPNPDAGIPEVVAFSADGQLEADLVLSRIVLPRQIRLGDKSGKSCIAQTVLSSGSSDYIEGAQCDSELEEQRFSLEEVQRPETGRPLVRLRGGSRCLIATSSDTSTDSNWRAGVDNCTSIDNGSTNLFSITGSQEMGFFLRPLGTSRMSVYVNNVGSIGAMNSPSPSYWTRLRMTPADEPVDSQWAMPSIDELLRDATQETPPLVQVVQAGPSEYQFAYDITQWNRDLAWHDLNLNIRFSDGGVGTSYQVIRDQVQEDGASVVRFRSTFDDYCLSWSIHSSGSDGYSFTNEFQQKSCDSDDTRWLLRPIAPGSPQFTLEPIDSSTPFTRCLSHGSSFSACPAEPAMMSALRFRFFFRKVQ